MRPGAVAWGYSGQPGTPQPDLTPAATEHALAAAAKDPDRVTDLLDELSRGRLWLPLPEDERPVTDGSAVLLPTVTYLGAEFVPAFTSAQQLAAWHGRNEGGRGGAQAIRGAAGQVSVPAQQRPDDPARRSSGADGPFAAMPHIVVPAAELARLLPAGMGIALNPGAGASVPIYPEGVGYLAATLVLADGAHVRVGRPPADPVTLLTEIRTALGTVPEVQQASRAWLSVPGQGEGLVISVTLHDPGSEVAHSQVITAIERAVGTVPEQGFPIDVTFPGEGEPDQVDEWISAHAEPFYIRT
ncbi:MAG: enhanced serine sensitivity protein SseB C-terminal domain-containing protein [Streptosporangiaceae bacterium]